MIILIYSLLASFNMSYSVQNFQMLPNLLSEQENLISDLENFKASGRSFIHRKYLNTEEIDIMAKNSQSKRFHTCKFGRNAVFGLNVAQKSKTNSN